MNATSTVRDFIRAWERDHGFEDAMREYFTPDCVYENVGLSSTTGAEESVAFITAFKKQVPFTSIQVENLILVAQGDIVMTERVDHLCSVDGRRLVTLRVMGVFEVRGGRIAGWRDYFDSAGLR